LTSELNPKPITKTKNPSSCKRYLPIIGSFSSDEPIHLWLLENPEAAQQIKQSFVSSSFRCCLWCDFTTLVEQLYKQRKGRCQALEAEVPPDHNLAKRLQLLTVTRSSGYANKRDLNGVLGNLVSTLACSYVHLPSEELNARLVPEEVRVASVVGGGVKGERYCETRQKEEKAGGGSEGGKMGKEQKGCSSHSRSRAKSSGGGRGEEEKGSSKGGNGGKSQDQNSSSSSDSKGQKGVDQADKGGSSRTDPVKDACSGRGKEGGNKGAGSAGTKSKEQQNASRSTSSLSGSGPMVVGGCEQHQTTPYSSSSSSNDPWVRMAGGTGGMVGSSSGKEGSSNASSRDMSSGGTGGNSSSSSSGIYEGEDAAAVATSAAPSDDQKPGHCKHTSSGASISQDSRSTKVNAEEKGYDDEEEEEEEEQPDESDVKGDVFGKLSPGSTMWEIADQNTAAVAAYAKTVKADREAAAKRGEGPEEPLPFHFTWPGKPLDAVFAHWLFTNLPVGGAVGTLTPPNLPSATLGGPPTALHLQLVLELLLLCWPDPRAPYPTGTSKVPGTDVVEGQRWLSLQLMVALLQQTSTEQKQLILQQRGPLLMQLLYQVLLEDKGLGAGDPAGVDTSGLVMVSGDMAWHSWFLVVTKGVVSYPLDDGIQWAVSVPTTVTMVLQNLLFESLPESLVDPKTARIGKSLAIPFGKCGNWGSRG
jgi:hypothetical protein